MAVYDAVDGSPQRHRNVPIRDSDGPKAGVILAFAERLLLAKSSRQWTWSITTGLHPKADKPTLVSVFSLISSVIGGKADIKSSVANVRS